MTDSTADAPKHRILIVDDEPFVVRALAAQLDAQLRDSSVEVAAYTDAGAALDSATRVAYDVVISDYRMRPIDGIEFLKRLRAIQPDCVRLMVSATHEMSTVVRAVNDAGVYKYLPKPWPRDLATTLIDAIARHDADAEERRHADGRDAGAGEHAEPNSGRRRPDAGSPSVPRAGFVAGESPRFENP